MFQNQQEYTCHRANLYSKAADWGHSCFVRKYSIKGIEFFQVFKTFFFFAKQPRTTACSK